MFGKKIKLDDGLYDRIKRAAELSGCATAEEFALTVLERETTAVLNQSNKQEATQSERDQIASKLQGLGYLE